MNLVGQTAIRPSTMNPSSLVFTIFLGLLAALPALSIDISAPTLAMLPSVLATSQLVAGLTLSLFMVGFALGQVAGGTFSDRHGRKPVLLSGFLVYCAAGMACALAVSGPSMVAFRFLQGLGAGTCAVMSFAMVQDLFQGAAARTKRSYVTVVVGIAPILAPAIGAVIIHLAGWRAVHGVLAAGGVALLVVTRLWLAESRPSQLAAGRPTTLQPPTVRPAALWQDRRFVNLALVNSLSYAGSFAYIAGSPVVVMSYYHGTAAIYAAVFACMAMSLAGGAWTGGRLSRRGVPAETLLPAALAVSAIGSVALVAACFTSPAISGPLAIGLLPILQFCRGVIAPNLQHLAIDRQSQRAGTASAAVGVSQLMGGALSSVAVAGLLTGFGPLAVAGPIMLTSVAAFAMWQWTVYRDPR